MRRLALLMAVLPVTFAGCGEKSEKVRPNTASPQPFRLMLDWFPNADHVGLYQALAEGDFNRAGLSVQVQVPSDPAAPLRLLAAGKIDAAISYEPEVLLARNQNLPLASVAAIVQKPLTSIISLGSQHITHTSDLRGKRVGDAGIPYQHAYLTTILQHARLPVRSVKEINVGSDLVPAMLSGRVDATLGAYWNYEAIQLGQMGRHPRVIRMDQVGVPPYDELVVVVRQNTIASRSQQLRRFVQALARGYESTRRNPRAAVQNLVRMNHGLDPKLQLASVQATLSSFFPSGSGRPWGWQDPTQWNAYGQWMLGRHLIGNANAIPGASTNELLPGEGI